MIEACIRGELAADPAHRSSSDSRPFVNVTLRVLAGAETLLVSVAIFDAADRERVATLRKGARIVASGPLEVVAWTGRDGEERRGWRLTAREVITVNAGQRGRPAAPACRTKQLRPLPRRTLPPVGDARWLDA